MIFFLAKRTVRQGFGDKIRDDPAPGEQRRQSAGKKQDDGAAREFAADLHRKRHHGQHPKDTRPDDNRFSRLLVEEDEALEMVVSPGCHERRKIDGHENTQTGVRNDIRGNHRRSPNDRPNCRSCRMRRSVRTSLTSTPVSTIRGRSSLRHLFCGASRGTACNIHRRTSRPLATSKCDKRGPLPINQSRAPG